MRSIMTRRLIRLGPLLVLGLGGCAWSHIFVPGNTNGPANGPSGAASGVPVSNWQGPPLASSQHGPVAPGGVQPAQFAPGFSEQVSRLSQQMADTEDARKVLAARVRQLELQLQDKDKALVQASFEIQESATQIAKTREELQRWKLEMESLRSKLRNVERDNKTTLEAIIRTLEQFLDRDRETGRGPELLAPPSSK